MAAPVVFALLFYWSRPGQLVHSQGRTAEINCEYTEKKQPSAKDRVAATIQCQQAVTEAAKQSPAETEGEEYDSPIAIAKTVVWKTLSDPVAAFTALLFLGTMLLWLATERTIRHARKSSERELRAYVAVAPMGIVKQVGKPLALGHVELRNVGKLPANRVFLSVQIETGKRDREDFPLAPDEPPDRTVQPGAAMPQGSKREISTTQPIAPTDHVFVWGTAWYDDGITKDRRFARFCHRYSAEIYNLAVKRSAKSSRVRFVIDADKARYHTHGNDAD